jgi:subtilisin family serine protease
MSRPTTLALVVAATSLTVAAATLPSAATAAPRAAQLRVDGRDLAIRLDDSLVAYRQLPGETLGAADGRDAAEAFRAMRVVLAPASESHAQGARRRLGIPVWFESGAVAVMTDTVLVKADRRALPADLAWERSPAGDGVFRARAASEGEALELANALGRKPGVAWAHPDFRVPLEARSLPTDEPFFSAQWNLHNTGQTGGVPSTDINVLPAWTAAGTGVPSTLVAVLDLGFEQAHPGLAPAWYVNTREIPGNKKDDDGNGLVDDVSGWNYAVNGTNLIYGMAPSHGTATSGVVGARADGAGTTGICPRCTVLPLVVDDSVENQAAAFAYAQRAGAAVISNSWGYRIGEPRFDVVINAIAAAATNGRGGLGTTIVFAMSNFGKDDCREPEPDISALPTVVAVSSIDHQGHRVEASGFGLCLEVIAPSSPSQAAGVPTTDRMGDKGYNTGSASDFDDLSYSNTFYGTSAAAPQVAGVFALLYSAKPSLTAADALRLVTRTATKIEAGVANYDATTGLSRTHGYGMINAGAAVEALLAR